MKMLLNLTYFLLVTLYYVESLPLERRLDPSLEHRTVGVGHPGCWPKTINEQQVLGEFDQKFKGKFETDLTFSFLVEENLWKNEANRKAQQAIAEDPENTICERAWWLFKGWTIKCTRAPYDGLDCGSGVHNVMWSKEKFHYRAPLIATEELN